MAEEVDRTDVQMQGIIEKVSQILAQDETIVYTVVQQMLAGPKPNAIVLTNKRFIVYRPGLISVKFEDYLWLNLRDAHLEEGLLGAKLSFLTAEGKKVSVERLPKDKARRAYAIAQEKEQEALEIRRLRKIEEDRAKAGGVMIGAPSAAPAATAAADPMAKMTKLRALFDAGLITEEEYNNKKAEILAAL
jgi:hypothetical protein